MLSENLNTHPTFVTSIIIYTLPLIQIIVNVLVPSHIILKNDRAKDSQIFPLNLSFSIILNLTHTYYMF